MYYLLLFLFLQGSNRRLRKPRETNKRRIVEKPLTTHEVAHQLLKYKSVVADFNLIPRTKLVECSVKGDEMRYLKQIDNVNDIVYMLACDCPLEVQSIVLSFLKVHNSVYKSFINV